MEARLLLQHLAHDVGLHRLRLLVAQIGQLERLFAQRPLVPVVIDVDVSLDKMRRRLGAGVDAHDGLLVCESGEERVGRIFGNKMRGEQPKNEFINAVSDC